jgi:hypothetical protein
MKKTYRLYSDDYEGEYTQGYIELSKKEYDALSLIAKELEMGTFELEEVESNLLFDDILGEKLEDVERQRKYREEQEKDSFFVSMREKASKKFSDAMERLDKKYKGNTKAFEYMAERMGILSSFNQEMMMIEMSYASKRMMSNYIGDADKKEGKDE